MPATVSVRSNRRVCWGPPHGFPSPRRIGARPHPGGTDSAPPKAAPNLAGGAPQFQIGAIPDRRRYAPLAATAPQIPRGGRGTSPPSAGRAPPNSAGVVVGIGVAAAPAAVEGAP